MFFRDSKEILSFSWGNKKLFKNLARIFADYGVPGQINVPFLCEYPYSDYRKRLISKNDKSISKNFDMAID